MVGFGAWRDGQRMECFWLSVVQGYVRLLVDVLSHKWLFVA